MQLTYLKAFKKKTSNWWQELQTTFHFYTSSKKIIKMPKNMQIWQVKLTDIMQKL